MGIYYSAVEGDPLDSGGNSCVIEGASNFTIEGEDGRSRGQAFIGHKAYCDACKSVGPIVAAQCSPIAGRTETFPRTLSADLAEPNQRMAFVRHAAQRFDMLLNGPARRDIDQSLIIIATGSSLR
jgi:hypothetical protein